MRNNNPMKYVNDKELHYELVRKYFRKSAEDKSGFYNSKSAEEIEHELKKRRMWRIYTSTLDDILKKDSEISSVIDAACGMGNFTIELVKRNHFKKIVGIDFLKETFDIACKNKQMFGNIFFLQGNLLNLPIVDKSFDFTVCLNTLHHIHKNDLSKAVYELTRITKKYLMIEIRNKDYIFEFWFNKILLPKLYRDLPVCCSSISELNDLMKKNGFELRIIRGNNLLTRASWRLLLVYERI